MFNSKPPQDPRELWFTSKEATLLFSTLCAYQGALQGEPEMIRLLKEAEPNYDWDKRLYEMKTIYNYPNIIKLLINKLPAHIERDNNPRNKVASQFIFAVNSEEELFIIFHCIMTLTTGLKKQYETKRSLKVFTKLNTGLDIAEKAQNILRTVYNVKI